MSSRETTDAGVVPDTVLTAVAGRVAEVDAGTVPTDAALAELGASGAFRAAARGEWPGISRVLEELAWECMSTAFSAWGHQVCLALLGPAELPVPEELVAGTTAGVSAMAPAFKWASGLGEIPVTARHEGGHVVLNGTIVWASNLFPGALVITPVVFEDGTRTVALFSADQAGVNVKHSPPLLALNGTASGFVALDDVRVPATRVSQVPLPEFLAAVRPGFLLAQSSFCLGLAARSLHEAGTYMSENGPNALFQDMLERLRSTAHRLRQQRAELERHVPSPLPVLQLRLEAAHLVVDATRLESTVAGGKGFLAGSGTTRRLREASFLPVQSPTEGHLLWEIERQKAHSPEWNL